jgi:hypothetical protein
MRSRSRFTSSSASPKESSTGSPWGSLVFIMIEPDPSPTHSVMWSATRWTSSFLVTLGSYSCRQLRVGTKSPDCACCNVRYVPGADIRTDETKVHRPLTSSVSFRLTRIAILADQPGACPEPTAQHQPDSCPAPP